nr:MAG TPA: hypothetical protein [Caudoviricetes sp.]
MTIAAAVCFLIIICGVYVAAKEIEKAQMRYERMKEICYKQMKELSK